MSEDIYYMEMLIEVVMGALDVEVDKVVDKVANMAVGMESGKWMTLDEMDENG